MNNNNGQNPKNHRRDVVTPAQRKERQEKKQLQKSNQKQEVPSRISERQNISEKNTGASQKATAPKKPSNAMPVKASPIKQKNATVNQPPAKQKNSQYEKDAAQKRRIRELERKIEHQRLVNESLLDKESVKPNNMNNKTKKNIIISVIAVLVVLNIIAFSSLRQKDIPDAPASSDASFQNSTNGTTNEIAEQVVKNDTYSIPSSDFVQGTLALVNSEHTYDFDYTGEVIKDDALVTVATKIKNKTFKAADYRVYLNSETVDMLNVMMADFYSYSKKNDVMINSAHRTYEQQKSILDSKIQQLGENQQIAQTPGNSEHHTGYAFDFAIYPDNGGGRTFTNEAPYTWIYENCHKYGFILRYPEGKSGITGIAPESWHFRYVGVPHSYYIYEKGKTLEEYLTDVSIYTADIPLTVQISETESYSVFYVSKTDSANVQFDIPKNTEYKISGDNVGGFVVWYNNADVGQKGIVNNENTEESSEQLS